MVLVMGILFNAGNCTPSGDILVKGITITGAASVEVNATTPFTTTITPINATDKSVTWASMNPTIASVDATTGIVRGMSTGTATIRATANDASAQTSTSAIQVMPATVKVTSITITPSTAVSVAEGATTSPLGVTVSPAGATNKAVTWSSLNAHIATVNASTGVVTGVLEGTATIRATAADGSAVFGTKTVTVEGVLVNGLVWATRNVNSFGTFAITLENPGMFYQWNRSTAYTSVNPLSPTWNSLAPSAVWNPSNNPCPTGWRLPTINDFEKLTVAASVSFSWDESKKGGLFTNRTTLKNIFLPAVGYRINTNGNLQHAGVVGFYWSSTLNADNVNARYFYMDGDSRRTNDSNPFACGMSVRCVKI